MSKKQASTIRPDSGRRAAQLKWLPGASALLSLLACYGTLALVASLSAIGVTLAVNVQIWAAVIVLFAIVAVLAIGAGYTRHRTPLPTAAALAGTLLVIWAMYGSHSIPDLLGLPSQAVELVGFALLVGAAVWDWRLRKVES